MASFRTPAIISSWQLVKLDVIFRGLLSECCQLLCQNAANHFYQEPWARFNAGNALVFSQTDATSAYVEFKALFQTLPKTHTQMPKTHLCRHFDHFLDAENAYPYAENAYPYAENALVIFEHSFRQCQKRIPICRKRIHHMLKTHRSLDSWCHKQALDLGKKTVERLHAVFTYITQSEVSWKMVQHSSSHSSEQFSKIDTSADVLHLDCPLWLQLK